MGDLVTPLDELQPRLQTWFVEFDATWQLLALAAVAMIAWLMTLILRSAPARSFDDREGNLAALARLLRDRLLFPTSIALGATAAALVLAAAGVRGDLLRLIAVLAATLIAVRIAAYALKRVLPASPMVSLGENAIVGAVWAYVVLRWCGWLGPVTGYLDSLALNFGNVQVSVLDAIRAVVTILAFVIAAAYVGAVLERKLMASRSLTIGVRVGLAKTLRFGLILLAALLAVNLLGVDLGGLAVIGGAIGVGIGFGLQRIASNFISGFILIGDRSIRPGDVITIGERFGVVRELRARYVVVRDRDGVDTLIPNENIITSEVINWSYADRAIRLKLPIQISYRDDPRQAMQLLLDAAKANGRVEKAPEPAARVMNFGENGIDLELRFWIRDPEDGVNNVRSDLYLAIWDAFNAMGITIPYPQRDVHMRVIAVAGGNSASESANAPGEPNRSDSGRA